ncbi:MAG: hypothetical protein PHF86_02235 [Candidatus Nanoarchaeia archaeon]|nr:hypothetical protein [Candidatus Nanoarchaeia archaeon]
MKLVRENLNFTRGENPMDELNIGKDFLIKKWMFSIGLYENDDYKINEDGTLDVFEDINLSGLGLEELPEYINFNKVYKNFYAKHNNWKSLKGFPKEVLGDFSIYPKPSGGIISKSKWLENEIRKKIKVNGTVWC